MRFRHAVPFLLSASLLQAQSGAIQSGAIQSGAIQSGAIQPGTPKPGRVGQRPYMGWSSWSSLREKMSEAIILAQAQAMLDAGLPALGYRYVNVDDGWDDGWDEHGMPRPNLKKFPNGMDGLARKLHAQGLLFGIYLNPGIREELYRANPAIPGTTAHIQDITDTTQVGSTRYPLGEPEKPGDKPHTHAYRIDFSKPAAAAYIRALAAQLDRWGVDFVKLDFVGPGGGNVPSDNREELRQWHRALAAAHRPIWLELSNFMSLDQASLWRETSNGWRIENDIECYGCAPNPDGRRNLTRWSTVAERFTDVRPWIRFAGPSANGMGGWNDLDSLELGNGDRDGLTPDERQSMFTLWAISCAPLYIGSDLTRLDPSDLPLLSNRRIIAIDQAGVPATPVDLPSWRAKPSQQLWLTRYPDGSVVLAVFNLGEKAAEIDLPLDELDTVRDTHLAASPTVALADEIDGTTVHAAEAHLKFPLEPHASRLFRFIPAR